MTNRQDIESADIVRKHATKLLSELMNLDSFATSQQQRCGFKEAREYLQNAIDTGSDTALKLGSFSLAILAGRIREVREAKQKGIERSIRCRERGEDTA